MAITLKLDPGAVSGQAHIILSATPNNDGAMTKEQAAQLASLPHGPLVGVLPIVVADNEVSINPATETTSGSLSATDQVKINNLAVIAGMQPLPSKVIIEVFARSSGSDATGNGTIANPYQTPDRALQDCPLNLAGSRFRVNLSGYGSTYTPTQKLRFPVVCGSQVYENLYGQQSPDSVIFGQYHASDIELYAEPTTNLTIAANDYTASFDDVTGFITFTKSNAAWTVDQWKDQLISVPGSFISGRVLSNTATELVTNCLAYNYFAPGTTSPIYVRSNTATIDLSTIFYWFGADGTRELFRGCNATITIAGIDFIGPDYCLVTSAPNAPILNFVGCKLVGPGILFGQNNAFYAVNSHFESTGPDGVGAPLTGNAFSANFLGCKLKGVGVFGNNTGSFNVQGCDAENSDSIGEGNYHTFGSYARGDVDVTYSRAHDTSRGGIRLMGVKKAHVAAFQADNCALGGLRLERGAYLLVDGKVAGTGNTEGGAILIDNSTLLILRSGAGPNPADVTVTGAAGDLIVGANAARTWEDFFGDAPIGVEADLLRHGAVARFGDNGGVNTIIPPFTPLTTTERDALGAVADGTIILNTSDTVLQVRLAGQWKTITVA